jgi:hypothetical protein
LLIRLASIPVGVLVISVIIANLPSGAERLLPFALMLFAAVVFFLPIYVWKWRLPRITKRWYEYRSA